MKKNNKQNIRKAITPIIKKINKLQSKKIRDELMWTLRSSFDFHDPYKAHKLSETFKIKLEMLIKNDIVLNEKNAIHFLQKIGIQEDINSFKEVIKKYISKQKLLTYGELIKISKNNQNLTSIDISIKEIDNLIHNSMIILDETSVSLVHILEERYPKIVDPSTIEKGKFGNGLTIKTFRIQNFCGINDLELSEIPINNKWIVFSGPNGGGKSALLKALSLGLSNEDDLYKVGVDDNLLIGFEFYNHKENSNEISNYRDHSSYKEKNINFCGYGPSRLSTLNKESQNKPIKESEKLYSLFHNDGYLNNIEYTILKLKAENNGLYKDIIKYLIETTPSIEDIEVKGSSFFYKEKISGEDPDLSKNNYQSLSMIQQLSNGNKAIISMIGDIIIRLLEFPSNQAISKLKDLTGIILIDELELHLHPNWQRKLPGKMTKLFPNVQFIISTNSPLIVLGLPKESIIAKVEKSINNGICIEKVDIEHLKCFPEQLLTSPIFDLDNLEATEKPKNMKINYEKSYTEIVKNQQMINSIKQKLKNISLD